MLENANLAYAKQCVDCCDVAYHCVITSPAADSSWLQRQLQSQPLTTICERAVYSTTTKMDYTWRLRILIVLLVSTAITMMTRLSNAATGVKGITLLAYEAEKMFWLAVETTVSCYTFFMCDNLQTQNLSLHARLLLLFNKLYCIVNSVQIKLEAMASSYMNSLV